LLPILKEHHGQRLQDYAQGIGRSIRATNTALIDKTIASHPEPAGREADLAKFGRVL